MHLLWVGEVMVDVVEPICDDSRVWRPAERVA
jgi:hypothetical protein